MWIWVLYELLVVSQLPYQVLLLLRHLEDHQEDLAMREYSYILLSS